MFIRWAIVILGFGLLVACQSEETVPDDAGLSTPIEQPSPTLTQTFSHLPTQTDTPSKDLATPEATRIKGPKNSFAVGFGETVEIASEGITITFVEVTEDSRCPSDVQCVWAGRVTVALVIGKEGQDPKDTQLSLGSLSEGHITGILLGEVWITLFDVRPHLISTESIQSEDYVVVLVVEENDK